MYEYKKPENKYRFQKSLILDLINYKPITHGTVLEIVWTIIPAIILALIAFPSFSLLYAMSETIEPSMTLKIIGHQWYWSYEFSDFKILINQNINNVTNLIDLSNNIELWNRLVSFRYLNFLSSFVNYDFLSFLNYFNIFDFNIFNINSQNSVETTYFNSYSFDSYMVDTDDLIKGEKRLLETDVPLILPIKTHIRLLVTY